LLGLFFWPWRWRRHVPLKRRLAFNGLHCVVPQTTELFITTAVRTSNPNSCPCLVWDNRETRSKQMEYPRTTCVLLRDRWGASKYFVSLPK
jgi:hypothetical protein